MPNLPQAPGGGLLDGWMDELLDEFLFRVLTALALPFSHGNDEL